MTMPRIIVFSAHPDDAESCVGGAILDYRKNNAEVHIVHMTAEPSIRKKEARKSALLLDAKASFLGLKQMGMIVDEESVVSVRKVIEENRPSAVLTHWPVDFHPDHQAAGILVLRALNELEDLCIDLFFYEACTGYQSYYFRPNKYVDVTPYVDKKREAVACHRSQGPFSTWYPVHENMMTFRGYESGYVYAEGLIELSFRYRKTRDHIANIIKI